MTVVVLRPNATNFNDGAVTGAASAHAALLDNSDATYVIYDPGESSEVSFDDLTLPAGAVVKSYALRVRVARASVNSHTLGITSYVGDEPLVRTTYVTWPTPLTVWMLVPTSGVTDPQIDAARMTVGASSTGGGVLWVYAAFLDAYYVAKPVANVTAPTGMVTNTNQPMLTWSPVLDGDGGGQTHYEAKVFSAAQYGAIAFDPYDSAATDTSGVVASNNGSRQVGRILPDGDYRAYVRVAQTVNGVQHWSAWDFEEFTIDVVLPRVPQMTVTPQAASGRMNVRLDNTPGGAVATQGFDLERSVDNGVTWRPVRTAQGDTGRITDTSGIDIYDYEAPNGTVVLYRARALHAYGEVYAASNWNVMSYSWEDGTEQGWTTNNFTTVFGSQLQPAEATSGERVLRCIGTITDNDGSVYSPPFAITPGRAISARADIYVATPANGLVTGKIVVQFDNGTGSWGMTPAEGPNIAGGTGPRVATIINAVAPAGAVRARLRIVGDTSGTSTINWLIDTVQYRIGNAAGGTADLPGTTWSSTQWWLKDPVAPAENVPIELRSYANVDRAVRRALIQPLGAAYPIAMSDTPASAAGEIIVQARTRAKQEALDALLATTAILLLQGPDSHGEPDRYVSLGDASAVRVVDNGNYPMKRTTLPWNEVEMPAGPQAGDQYTDPHDDDDDDGEELVVA